MNSPEWVKSAVFYQIFPERFANGSPANDPPGTLPWGTRPTRDAFMGGDLQGILDRLPYLEDLGVTALYLTPIFAACTNHKYDTCDYFRIDPAFGDEALFKRLVNHAHNRGIRIVLDAVFNHCGDGFWAFTDLMQKGAASRYKDWFFVRSYPIRQNPPNYQTCGGAEYLPKLNTANPEVRDHLIQAATYWVSQFGIDGWRLDVPWKADPEFWKVFYEAVKRVNPEAYIVGEVWRDPTHWLKGETCDGIMNYPLREYLLDYCVHDHMDAEDFDHFCGRLRQVYGPTTPFHLNLLSSHDTARIRTLAGEDPRRVLLAAAAQFTSPGIPMVYYGDEIGMPGGNDPDCRRCMIWDSAQWHADIYSAHQKLIWARKNHAALERGDFIPLLAFNGVYVYQRATGADRAVVILNPRGPQHDLKIPLLVNDGEIRSWKELFTGKIFVSHSGTLRLDTLPEMSARILLSNGENYGKN